MKTVIEWKRPPFPTDRLLLFFHKDQEMIVEGIFSVVSAKDEHGYVTCYLPSSSDETSIHSSELPVWAELPDYPDFTYLETTEVEQ